MECSANTHPALLCARRGGSKELKALSGWWEGRRRWCREDSCKQIVCVHTLEVRWVSHTPTAFTSKDICSGDWSACCRRELCLASGRRAEQASWSPSCHSLAGGRWGIRGDKWPHVPWMASTQQLTEVTSVDWGPVGRWLWGFNPNSVTYWQCDPRMHGASLGIPGFPHLKTRVAAVPRCNGLKVFIPLKLTGWSLNPHSEGIRRWGPWEVIRSGALMNAVSVLMTETPESSLTPSTMRGHGKRWVLMGPWICQHLHLRLPASTTAGNNCVI